MRITEKQWKWINDVTLRIHATYDLTEMRRNFLSVLGTLIQYDKATFYIQQGDNPYGKPIAINLTEEDLEFYINNCADMDPLAPLMTLFTDLNRPTRSSDYAITTAIENTEYYKQLWEPKNIRYSMLMPLSVKGIWLGSVNLFRGSDKEDFTETELEIAKILMDHMQVRLWRDKCIKDEIKKFGAVQNREQKLMSNYGLTERECEVVSMTTKGLTDMEICESMAISKNTLKKHISNIYSKLEISSRVELIKIINE